MIIKDTTYNNINAYFSELAIIYLINKNLVIIALYEI